MYKKAFDYCNWAIDPNNNKVPRYVKKQCAKFMDIVNGKDDISYFDHDKATKIVKLLSLINVPKGEGAGSSVVKTLTGFQWLLLVAPFCVMMNEDHEKRRYENILLEICRKNAKSYVSALICLILMILEPKFSRFFTVAPTGALSRETFRQIKEFVSVSPALEKHFKLRRDNIICTLTESEYTPLNYSSSTLDGRLPNAFLGDEIGALKDPYALESMRSGAVLLKNKLGIVMSTKYPTIDNVFEDEVDYGKKVLDGVVDDITTFSLLYEPDNPQGDWTKDETILAHGNPLALDVPVLWDNLISKRNKAIETPSTQSNFLTKHCNIITIGNDTEQYTDPKDVQSCETSETIDWNGKDVYVGIDLSLSDDNCSVSMVGRDEYGRMIVAPMCFIPTGRKELKERREKCKYSKYIEGGTCIECGDDIIDYSVIEQYIIDLPQKYGVNIIAVGYDRYNAMSTVGKLTEAGIDCIEVKQHSSVLGAPTKLLYEEVCKHNLRFCTNELYKINFANAVCTYDTNLTRFVHKKKSNGKVDMVVATLDAVALLQQNELLSTDWVCQ